MKLAITGSRKFNDYPAFVSAVDHLSPAELVSGGAHGADAMAERYGRERGLHVTVFLPKFKTDKNIPYHPRWYLERNKEIVDYADHVLAFHDGKSKGTLHTINYARKTGKRVDVNHFGPPTHSLF